MNKSIFRAVVLGTAAISLSGCIRERLQPVGPSQPGMSSVTPVTSGVLPVPTRGDGTPATRTYLIGPGDRLLVDVAGIELLRAREVQVDAAGRISIPMAGAVEAGGKAPEELEREITRRLRAAYVRNPVVSVNVREAVGQLVTVDGQVKVPGQFPIIGSMTLMQSVARAQGLTQDARLDDVLIFRTSESRRYVGIYNLGAIRRGVYDDPEVFAGDVVVVGDSPRRRLLRETIGVIPALLSPLIYVLAN